MGKQRDEETTKPLNNGSRAKPSDTTSGHPGLDTGWSWMVLLASFGSFCSIGGTMLAVGIIHQTLLERFKESVSLTSWIGALHSSIVSLGAPLGSAIIDRYSCRVALIASGLCYVIGYMGTALAPNFGVAFFTCGIISGFGGGLGYVTAMVVVGFNFKKRRNIANGISLSGVGIGMFSFANLMQYARQQYGSEGFFVILAAMSANIVTFGVMCFPSSLERQTQRDRKAEKLIEDNKGTCDVLYSFGSVLTNRSVLCLCTSMFFYCFGTYLMFVHLPSYTVECGFTPTQASYVVSLTGIVTVFGRIFVGFISNMRHFNSVCIYSGSMGCVAVALFTLPLYSKFYVGHVVFGICYGLFFGMCYVVMPSVNIECVGINYLAIATGLEFFFAGVGSLIGPVFAGLIVDNGGNYDHAIILAAVSVVMGSAFGLLSSCCRKVLPEEQHITEITIPMTKSEDGPLVGNSYLNDTD